LKVRRILAYISAICLIGMMIYAMPAMWDAVFANRLMELKKLQTLRMPITGDKIAIKWLFASFFVLMVATILRYLWRLVTITLYGPPGTELEDLVVEDQTPEGRQ
ncbi:MAG: C4-dicarboxylate ABC transporter permease, partial [Paracoccaceae bacterium]|nr:C4-dicarboxylate ABC transporter permease [Paracoccaceae bacterium]